ncbi:MAG: NUDIX domain-containing protein [Candidatus Woesearchaeota archaeon]
MVNFSLSAKAFIVRDNKLLLLKRPDHTIHRPGIWELPGGRIKHGENPFLEIMRETKEKTGLEIEVKEPLTVRHFVRDDNQTITMIIFLCEALNNEVKISDEHVEFTWIDLDKCKGKIHPWFYKEIDTYLKRTFIN